MMDFPQVYILIVTYDRPKEIRQVIYGLLKHLKYPREKLLWHLADDNSPGTYLEDIKREFHYLDFTATITERKGWGANVNKAMVYCWNKSSYVFLIEDDYVAQREIDLERGVALLMADERIGAIRYDGISAHDLNLALREIQTDLDMIDALFIQGDSPHLNIYSNRPHLKKRKFHDVYGLYPVGQKLGETESMFAHRVKDRYHKSPKIAVLDNGIVRAFDHIGHSRQGTNLDV